MSAVAPGARIAGPARPASFPYAPQLHERRSDVVYADVRSRVSTRSGERGAVGQQGGRAGRQRYTKITELYPGVHPPSVRNQPATFSATLYPMTANAGLMKLAP